jgi:hypothetical protein
MKTPSPRLRRKNKTLQKVTRPSLQQAEILLLSAVYFAMKCNSGDALAEFP